MDQREADAGSIAGILRGLLGMHEGSGEDAEDAFASLERELGMVEPAQHARGMIDRR